MKQKFERSEVILNNPVYALHFFRPEKKTVGIPVLIIPPHAGRHGSIAQKIADTCSRAGANTYAIELHSATQDTKDTTVDDLVKMILDCHLEIDIFNGMANIDLVCLCQGAWLGAIYAAKYPDMVNRYANFAGPINTKCDPDNVIETYCRNVNMAWHRSVVRVNGGIQPWYLQWPAFSMVNPYAVYFKRWHDLGNVIFSGDEGAFKKINRNNGWYDETMDLAGPWFLDCLENHFRDNRLYDGTWTVGGATVNLGNITCPCYLYAGDNDEITSIDQVFSMSDKVSSRYVKSTIFPGAGHTKVFTGSKELSVFAKDFFGKKNEAI